MTRRLLSFFCLVVCCHAYAESPAAGSADATADAKAEFSAAYKTYQQLIAEGKRAEAVPYAEKAYRLGTQIYGESHKNSAALALNYGDALLKTGHAGEAIPVLDDAIRRFEQAYGKDAEELVDPLMARGDAAPAFEPKEQRQYFDRAIELAKDHAKADSLLVANLNSEAGIRLVQTGNADDAKRYLDAAYTQYKKQLPATDARFGNAAFWLGKYSLAKDKPEDAEPYLNQALTAFEAPGSPATPLRTATHALLVTTYQELGHPELANDQCVAVGKLSPWDGKSTPTPIFRTTPDYPAEANGREGFALIEFTITANGSVTEPKLVKTEGSDSFGPPALAAISAWRYAPRIVNDVPVDTSGVQAQVNFKMTP